MNPVVDDVAELTAGWLTGALAAWGHDAPVATVAAERIGTGQIGTCYRLSLTYEHAIGDAEPGPATLVAKMAGGDAAARDRVKEGFAKEVGFYTELAGHRRRAHPEVLVRRDHRRQDELRPPARRPGAARARVSRPTAARPRRPPTA